MEDIHTYEVTVKWDSNRKGVLESPVLNSTIEVVTPPEFPKGMAGIWSPEHLFVAAVNSCLMTTFLSIAEHSKLEFIQFQSKGIGKLEKKDGKLRITEISLFPVITIESEDRRAKAERVLQLSESNCLISNSINSTIVFIPEVKLK